MLERSEPLVPALEDPDLSEGWTWTTIGQACQLNPPKPSPDALPADELVTFVPMPAVDANSGTIASAHERTFGEVRKGYTAFRNDDVIMAKITPCMENGKAAIAHGLTNGLGFGSTEFHVLRPSGVAIPEYLFYYVRQESFRTAAEAEMTGSVGQRRVPTAFLNGAPIPLPPLAEQKRIVEKVEALLAQVDASRERLAKVPAILKRFRQAVLAAACSGRLTADWREAHPDAESAVVRLEWIKRERRQALAEQGAGQKVYRDPTPPNPSVEVQVPEGWAVASMDELTAVITSGSRDWTKYYSTGTGTFIMAQNVRPGRLDLTHRQAVDPPSDNRDRARSQIRRGDLLVTIVGANTGDICEVPADLPEHYVCQSVALMRPVDTTLSPFLNLYLNSEEHGRSQYESFIYGAGRPHLSFDQLKVTAIAMPPLAEQHEIVRRVEALFKLADAIERRVELATTRAERLTQAVLAKAFRGDLVPTEAELARREGRGYEPAVLLERISRERTGQIVGRGSRS